MTNICTRELLHVDFETFKKNEDRKFPCIITDPPYGVDFNNKIYNDTLNPDKIDLWMKLMEDSLEESGHIYIFVPSKEIDIWTSIFKKYFDFKNIIATKSYNTNKVFKNRFNDSLQLILFGSKKHSKDKPLNKVDWIERSKSWLKDKRCKDSYQLYTYNYPSYLEEFANTKSNAYVKRYHPNQKNEELISKFIELSTKENEVVFDPFGGSFSTAEAAKMVNRGFICLEKNLMMYHVGIRRIFGEDFDE